MNNEIDRPYTHPSFPDESIPDETEMVVHTDPIRWEEYELITQTAKAPRPGEPPAQAALRGSTSIAIIGFMRDTMIFPD